jgi:hypothetical protein
VPLGPAPLPLPVGRHPLPGAGVEPRRPRILTPKAFGWGFAALLITATVGLLAPAAPAWAAPATLQVNPTSITAGDTVVVSGSVGPAPAGSACATSVLLLSRAFAHTDEFAGVPAVVAAVRPDGTFSATTRIPSSTAAGTYDVSGRCGGGNLGVSATLAVRAAATATTTTAPAPSATVPPATQPTASTSNDLVQRWIVPLAAVAIGILIGLGGSLLYRRRHPTGPGGSGRPGEVESQPAWQVMTCQREAGGTPT